MKKYMKGYMTLEASVVVLFVVLIIGCMISLSFYCYTKVFFDQNCYLSALRGSRQINKNSSEVEEYTIHQFEKLSENQFLSFSKEEEYISVGISHISVEKRAEVEIPFLINQPVLSIECKAKAKRLYPGRTIRLYERSKDKVQEGGE